MDFWEYILDFMNGFGMRLVYGITILMFGLVIIRIAERVIRKLLLTSPLESSLVTFFLSILRFILYAALFMTVLAVVGVPLTSFVVIATALSLAVSLALQGSLSNMANGVVILSTKPFSEGDFVEINGVSGKVKAIRMLNTKIATPDNKLISIPNSKIIESNIVNYSACTTRRVELTVSVAYGSDVEQVKRLLMQTVQAHEGVLNTPDPIVRLSNMAEHSLQFAVKAWVSGTEYWDVFFDLTEQIYATLCKNNIAVPFPQMDVHVKGEPNHDTK